MSQGEQQPAQPIQQTEVVPAAPVNPPPVIGDDQWNKDITGFLTSNANNALAELGFNPNVLHAIKDAERTNSRLTAEKKVLEKKNRELSAHLGLANNRIDFSQQDPHSMWKEVVYYREKYHILQAQHQDTLRAHATCATGPPEQPYFHLLQELEKLQDMYRHILGQNTTLKFEVQRLMQQCVNAGLIPPPQNYLVTPLPALQPPSTQPGTGRRVSEPAAVSRQQQVQTPVYYSQAAQPGPVARQFTSPPSNPYTPNLPAANSPTVLAGPMQAYNYHRAQFPQPQQAPAQLMPPPQQQVRQTPPQQGQPSTSRQQPSATRPRQVVDLTYSDDERVPKRPRMASDPSLYPEYPSGSVTYHQHQAHAQVPAPAPHQVPRQRNIQPRLRMASADQMQPHAQQYRPQRSGTGPPAPYQQVPSSAHAGQYGTNTPPNVPTPPVSAPPVMDVHGTIAGEQPTAQIQGHLLDGQIQGSGQPPQGYMGPVHAANLAFPTANAGANHVGTTAEQSTGTPVGSTPAVPPPVSSQLTTNGHTRGRESSLPLLTEEQIQQMHSEVADSMFTEPIEGDETEARTCMLCIRRSELDLLPAPPQPALNPSTEEMYSHLQAQHPESLALGEQDWKADLLEMGPPRNQ